MYRLQLLQLALRMQPCQKMKKIKPCNSSGCWYMTVWMNLINGLKHVTACMVKTNKHFYTPTKVQGVRSDDTHECL